VSYEVTPEWIAHMACCCPHCGLRTIVEGRCRSCGGTKAHAGPYVIGAPRTSAPGSDPGQRGSLDRVPGSTCSPSAPAEETAPLSAYDEPVEPPPVVVPITPKVGVERVLVAIEKRGKKRKGSTQGSLF
jgi:hypothetical protein